MHPLWETWGELMHPHCAEILDILANNRAFLHTRMQQQPPVPGALQQQQQAAAQNASQPAAASAGVTPAPAAAPTADH